ncbi:hypothetical protein PYCCODRAFT_153819 [Trametes coccinea BRFM310]|uniref:Uncharacterized protein n=1 Tax=Trametes coccinea (strain BRFM310) TaxID=1353009 RepID=A0A1Y2IUW8_TRAC3|nr:hypothetical protein PYCCODRAFT_153819 [Trametes coccinea BRFM310]
MEPLSAFPALPSEIVIHILEETARSSHEGACSVSLVSKWAREIALPHLFATLVHHMTLSFSVTLSTGVGQPPRRQTLGPFPSKYGHFVRNLWTECVKSFFSSVDEELILACPNLQSVALESSSLRLFPFALRSPANALLRDKGHPIFGNLHTITVLTHTYRYHWEPLATAKLLNGMLLLHNITHLRLTDMRISAYCPHDLLPNLTHLALPFLDLGNNFEQRILRLPDGVLQRPELRMIVLTIDEKKWLENPWYLNVLSPGKVLASPRQTFRTLVEWARQRDHKLHVLLSPRTHVEPWQEWAAAARGGPSIWDAAEDARERDTHGDGLPESFFQASYR